MRPLTDKEFKAEAEQVLRQVFASDNPFALHPFAKTIPQRRVVFGLEYDLKYTVNPPLIDALTAAALTQIYDEETALEMLRKAAF